ncbi:MAG: hypothetical protein R3E10_10250 [Gemmatimonadota bacterium]
MVRLVLRSSLLILLASGCDFKYEWESLGPFETSGPVRHLIVDPVVPRRLYAAAENGGLWVLDDVARREVGWRPLSDQLENLQMRGVAKSMVDSSYVVTANALGRVYHTLDHGESWSRISTLEFSYIRRLLLREGLTRIPAGNYTKLAKETTVLVAGSTGLHRLRLINDAFAEVDTLFPRLPAHGSDVLDLARHPSLPDLLFIGVRRQGVWRSQDGGASWALVADWASFGDSASDMIRLATNGTRTVAKFGRNLLVNDAGGAAGAWQPRTVGFGSDSGGSDIGYRGNYSGRRGEWTQAVAISPTDTAVLAAGQVTLFLSTDGGATWDTTGAGHEDMQALTFAPNDSVLYVANDGGVWSVSRGRAAPLSLNRNLTTLQFYRAAKSGSRVVGNADHQGIRGTRDVEADPPVWERATAGASGYGNNGLENDFVFGDPTVPGRFYVAFADRDVLRLRYPLTGATQDLLQMNAQAAAVRPFTMRTRNRAVDNQLNYPVGTVAADPRPGGAGLLLATHRQPDITFEIRQTTTRTQDPTGGPRSACPPPNTNAFCFNPPLQNTSTFTTVYGPISTPIVSVAWDPVDPTQVFALLEDGQVIVERNVDDAVSDWDSLGVLPLEPGGVARQLTVDAITPGGLFAMSHGRFFRSFDGGVTWLIGGVPSGPTQQLNAFVQHPSRARSLYLGTNVDVLVSTDRGAHWRSIGERLPNAPVMQLFVAGSDLYAVTFGRGLWRVALPG